LEGRTLPRGGAGRVRLVERSPGEADVEAAKAKRGRFDIGRSGSKGKETASTKTEKKKGEELSKNAWKATPIAFRVPKGLEQYTQWAACGREGARSGGVVRKDEKDSDEGLVFRKQILGGGPTHPRSEKFLHGH